MKRIINNTRKRIIFKMLLISMLSASLCACSDSLSENTEVSSKNEVVTKDNVETEYDNQEDVSSNEISEEKESDIEQNENQEENQNEEPKTIVILGTEYDINTELLDLSKISTDDIPSVAESICEMPELKTVNLIAEDGESSLLLSDVVLLKDAAPDVHFNYEFDLFDNRISTLDTEIKYINVLIGNEGEESIRQALTILDKCEYFLLDNCGIDDEIMAKIRDDFPNTKVVWRVHVGFKSALTDDPIIRMTHGIDDSMTGPLKYCNEVVYMDLGHDSGITDISFIENMPLLECLILSDAQFKDLSPVTHCPNLTWLELISCYSMENLSVINDMDSIKYLNISNSNTRDITGIMDMNLERFCCIGNYVPDEDFEKFKELHPDCMSVSSGNPYGYAWRYDDYGYHYFSYYARMRQVFRYDTWSPGGFKMPEDQ